ncbi:hypothetical protein BH09SUM1_BH09SUM1_33780 [soil metagenome]
MKWSRTTSILALITLILGVSLVITLRARSAARLEELLIKLRENPYQTNGPVEVEITALGRPATARLLKELAVSSGYEYNDLIQILARIPSKKRDDAFIAELEKYTASKEEDFLDRQYVPALMDALADSENQKAISLIERMAKIERPGVSDKAQIALSRMGKPRPARDPALVWDAEGDAKARFGSKEIEEPQAIALAVLDQALFDKKVTVTRIEHSDSKGWVFSGREAKGSWSIEIGSVKDNKVTVTTSYVCGGLCGEGNEIVLVRREGRWVVIKMTMTWVS